MTWDPQYRTTTLSMLEADSYADTAAVQAADTVIDTSDAKWAEVIVQVGDSAANITSLAIHHTDQSDGSSSTLITGATFSGMSNDTVNVGKIYLEPLERYLVLVPTLGGAADAAVIVKLYGHENITPTTYAFVTPDRSTI